MSLFSLSLTQKFILTPVLPFVCLVLRGIFEKKESLVVVYCLLKGHAFPEMNLGILRYFGVYTILLNEISGVFCGTSVAGSCQVRRVFFVFWYFLCFSSKDKVLLTLRELKQTLNVEFK
mmetsp:Transcript_24571/g.27950  ORF Transcript_24571/g.27950 Transcript_24571/m.27950 type:complete len:119 (+) Transcript_24571:54-410(+)